MQQVASRSLLIASLLIGLAAAPLAVAGEGHGYPQTTSSYAEFSRSSVTRTSEASGERAWSDEQSSERSGQEGWSDEHRWSREHGYRGWHGRDDRPDWDDGEVGYLPVSFFGDAGGVGPFPVDYGYGGGGGGYVYGGGSASGFAGAHASASASVSVSIGFHGGFHGGGGHHGGGHGCGCK